jgi:hypothetical protein
MGGLRGEEDPNFKLPGGRLFVRMGSLRNFTLLFLREAENEDF